MKVPRSGSSVSAVAVLASCLAWWAAPGRAQAPSAQAPPEGTGVILGRVVDAATGQPVPDAVLTVSPFPGRGARAGGPPADIGALLAGRAGRAMTTHVMAGADGQFAFARLPAGDISIRAEAPGYLDGLIGQGRPAGPSRPVTLADGERRGGIVVRLWPYASIEGRVVDEAGEPAVEATLRLLRLTLSMTGPRIENAGTARTDDRGVYRFGALPPGRYVVSAPYTVVTLPAASTQQFLNALMGSGSLDSLREMAADEGPPMAPDGMRIGDLTVSTTSGVRPPAPAADGRLFVYRTMYFPAARSIGEASILTLEPGERRAGVDLALNLVASRRVSGSVNGADGPVKNVAVHLEPTDTGEAEGLVTGDTATSRTWSDGRFTFLGVPPGAYRVRVTREPPQRLPDELLANPMMKAMFARKPGETDPPLRQASMSVQVGDADVDGLALQLVDGAAVSGRIEFHGSADRPTPKQILMSIVPEWPSSRGGAVPLNPADDFTFATSGHVPGRYAITVTSLRPTWTVESIRLEGADVTWSPFEISTTPITGVVVTMTDGAARLTGTVRGSQGPAPTAVVFVAPADVESRLAGGLHPNLILQRPASPAGAFDVTGLTPGDYLVAAIDDADLDAAAGPALVRELLAAATHVRVAPGEQRSIDLPLTKVRR